METSRLAPKKIILIVLIFIVFCVAFWFFSTYTWITLQTSSKGAKIITITDHTGAEVKSVELGDESKTLFIKRSTYKVVAIKGDEVSTYRKSLAPFWFNKLDIKLVSQRASKFLGKSELPCAKDKGNEIIFSSCSPYMEAGILASSTRGFLSADGSEDNLDVGEGSGTSGLLVPYEGGYMKLKKEGESTLTVSTQETNDDRTVSIDDYVGDISKNSIAVSSESDLFALFDSSLYELRNFRNMSDESPLRIPIPAERDRSYFINTVTITKDYTYFLSSVDYEVEDHSQIESGTTENPTSPPEGTQQKLFVFSNKTGELEDEHVLPDSWQMQSMNTGPSNQVLLTINILEENIYGQTYIIKGHAEPVEIEDIADFPQSVCWKDLDNFYYLSDSGQSIYQYSLSQQASFLIYAGLSSGTFVSNIHCDTGDLYFNFDHTEGNQRLKPEEQGYYHYKLTTDAFTGVRLESVLPIYASAGGEVVQGTMTIQGIKITKTYDEDNNPATPTIEASKQAILEELESVGVSTSGLNLYTE